jgi:hypothetical protein
VAEVGPKKLELGRKSALGRNRIFRKFLIAKTSLDLREKIYKNLV